MSLHGLTRLMLTEIQSTGTVSTAGGGLGYLSPVIGIAKKTTPTGQPVTLANVQVVCKKWIDDTDPGNPTAEEWTAGQLSSSNVTYDSATKTHTWTAGPLQVKTDGEAKNTIFARANWVVTPYPPVVEPDEPASLLYEATGNQMRTIRHGGDEEDQVQMPETVDILPNCVEGSWLLYKDLPVGVVGHGVRLMLNEFTPLRVAELGVSAAHVRWNIGHGDVPIIGVRRACGLNFAPADKVHFPFPNLPVWSVVLHQNSVRKERDTEPFVVMSHCRQQPDVVTVDPARNIYARLNFPDVINLALNGSYSLWVNPHVGFPNCPPCDTAPCT